MINLLLGAPGGGKSYEATVFHILPALEKGRKVITNLPLDVERIGQLDAAYADLIELRTGSKAEGMCRLGDAERPWRAFEHEADYSDPWRRADGVGPLYVIDECHLVLPRLGTRRAVEEWFSLHRHENADVLLITQSHGKMSAAVRDLVQVVYRVRKNVALGSMGSYTRKVQDGIRGEVVNVAIRKYEKRYFGLYRSHTRGRSAEELGAADVRPIWKNWTFIGAALCFSVVIALAASGSVRAPWSVPESTSVTKALPIPVSGPLDAASANGRFPAGTQGTTPVAAAPTAVAASAPESVDAPEPYAGRGLHLTGYLEMRGRVVWSFAISQNGQAVAAITDADLIKAGYTWHGESHCSGLLVYGKVKRAVICDSPQVGPGIPMPRKEAA